MALDVKERRFLAFILKRVLPIVTTFSGLTTYFGLWRQPVRLLGYCLITGWLIRLGCYLYKSILLRVCPRDPREYGKWAIVTGSTDGIGKAFALELARRGMSVLLISRSEQKLNVVREEILVLYPSVEVEVLVYDFTDKAGAEAFYAKLRGICKTKGENLGMLVNNVGIVNGVPEYVHELDEKTTLDILQVNIEGTVRMTRTVVPFLTAKRKGAVINVSSGSGNHPTPMISCYASTKAFITQFSQCLSHEMRDFNVDVLVITPYYVISNLFKRKDPTFIAPTAERVVQESLPLLGYYDKAFPYYIHAWCGALVNVYWDVGGGIMMAMKRTKERLGGREAAKGKVH